MDDPQATQRCRCLGERRERRLLSTIGGLSVGSGSACGYTYNQMVARHPITDQEADRLFKALADTTRRDILRRTMAGEVSVSDLASEYTMSFAAVQKHVAVLEAAGLVNKTPAGRERLVRADPERLARVTALLAELAELWHHRLRRLDDLFNDPQE